MIKDPRVKPENHIAIAVSVAKGRYRVRPFEYIDHVVIHRSHVAHNIRDTVQMFSDTRKYKAGWYTQGKMPYHFYIKRDGTVQQGLPITYMAPAAGGDLNKRGIHIALSGDLRKSRPSPAQVLAVRDLCIDFQRIFCGKLTIRGHTEEPGATVDKNKDCPGKHFNTQGLRDTVAEALVDEPRLLRPRDMLDEKGIVV